MSVNNTSRKTSAYLSIGSNKGETVKNLCLAIQTLKKKQGVRLIKVSSFYKTAPQNYTDQDWFVNAALKIETTHSPEALLELLKEIEGRLDKDGKPFRFGPRIIDLDIIFFGNKIIKTDRLELPHPRMHERCFVLLPLCDIDKDLVHPVSGQTTGELLKQIETDDTQAVIPLDQEETREIFY
ncbi:MAG: 2-amino-4-hydroxy-6-hydroxymethyldihydropteridine diphosphokinase [Desulfobacterales bacterium]|nr:2-amino-4-hydroxy-6-hydroxymethyldihydropteridine diphosphokinase [Desulfobacterales bacterium]